MSECGAGQSLSRGSAENALSSDLCNDRFILVGINHNADMGVVLGRAPNQRGAAYVNHLDSGVRHQTGRS